MKKLTLSAENEIVEQAKKLARRNNTSVSSMFAGFIKILSKRDAPKKDIPASSVTARATGFISRPKVGSRPKGKRPRDILTDALEDKYKIKV